MKLPLARRGRILSRSLLEALFVFTLAFLVSTWSLLCLLESAPTSGRAALRSSLESYLQVEHQRDSGKNAMIPSSTETRKVPAGKRETKKQTLGDATGTKKDVSAGQPPRQVEEHGVSKAVPPSEAVPKSESFAKKDSLAQPSKNNATDVRNMTLSESRQVPPQNGAVKATVPTESRAKQQSPPPPKTSIAVKATVPEESRAKFKSLVSKMTHQKSHANATASTNRNAWITPHYFEREVPLESLIQRGNVLTVHTGCAIATWSYQGKRHKYRPLNDCRQNAKSAEVFRAHQVTAETADQVKAYDTIYVPIVKLEHFVNTTLPNITQDFILMSGQNSKPPDAIPREVYEAIMKHPRIIKWFLQNLSVYAVDPHHPKLSPFPYGVHPMQPPALLEELKTPRNKTNLIFKSWFKKKNNFKARLSIERGEQVNSTEYLRRMHQSQYVLSPDGDRPECHRHYEAIALGTMPITSLDSMLYRHLQGNVVFEEQSWNSTQLEKRLSRKPVVNQRLVFEEYWMEFVEREVGRPLRWWDPSRDVRCPLAEIMSVVKNTTLTDGDGEQKHGQATNATSLAIQASEKKNATSDGVAKERFQGGNATQDVAPGRKT